MRSWQFLPTSRLAWSMKKCRENRGEKMMYFLWSYQDPSPHLTYHQCRNQKFQPLYNWGYGLRSRQWITIWPQSPQQLHRVLNNSMAPSTTLWSPPKLLRGTQQIYEALNDSLGPKQLFGPSMIIWGPFLLSHSVFAFLPSANLWGPPKFFQGPFGPLICLSSCEKFSASLSVALLTIIEPSL